MWLFSYKSQKPKAKGVNFWLEEMTSPRIVLFRAWLDPGIPMMPSDLLFLLSSLLVSSSLLPPPLYYSSFSVSLLSPLGSAFLFTDCSPQAHFLSSYRKLPASFLPAQQFQGKGVLFSNRFQELLNHHWGWENALLLARAQRYALPWNQNRISLRMGKGPSPKENWLPLTRRQRRDGFLAGA